MKHLRKLLKWDKDNTESSNWREAALIRLSNNRILIKRVQGMIILGLKNQLNLHISPIIKVRLLLEMILIMKGRVTLKIITPLRLNTEVVEKIISQCITKMARILSQLE